MQENRNDLASIITLEAGKPFKEALGEVCRTSFQLITGTF
jgi:acyl-CoA reductase-like NAD-dependent aldehyde dehydrogenase